MRMRHIREVQFGLIATGLLALGYCAVVYLDQRLFEFKESSILERKAALEPLTAEPEPHNGTVLGMLDVPRLGLSAVVVEGVDNGDLNRATGHIPGTAFPWQPGNVGIAGHRDTFFRPLRNIRESDSILLTTARGAYQYRVVSTAVVSPQAVQVLYPRSNDTLTLVTCFPFYYVGPAPKRFIVQAERAQQ